jgi:7-cyano-7-deazaguanine reductase
MQYSNTILGKIVKAPIKYSPDILHPIKRKKAKVDGRFFGVDDWVHYEMNWCDEKGCPQNAILLISICADSSYIVESKSLKLYLNSFNFVKINKLDLVSTIVNDLAKILGDKPSVRLFSQAEWLLVYNKKHLDNVTILDNVIDEYVEVSDICAEVLVPGEKSVVQRFVTHNFRSNCPVTGQPDWATIVIDYDGVEVKESSLYRYLLSYRQHQGFHEQCVEQIFADIFTYCEVDKLSVRGYFTRRGGLDINPFRSSFVRNSKLEFAVRQ